MHKATIPKVKSIGDIYKDLQIRVDGMAPDIDKFLGGNKSSGRRLRKALQEIKKQIKPWRDDIQAAIIKL